MSPQRIGLCTDSNAQLPPALVERYGVEVVPITITIDDDEYLEGVDLDADAFYARFDAPSGNGGRPTIGTSQPSPGQFALTYEELLDRGCTEILSIHVASSMSGTLNSARLAAHRLGVPVRLVDAATAGFGIGCCDSPESAWVDDGVVFTVDEVDLQIWYPRQFSTPTATVSLG